MRANARQRGVTTVEFAIVGLLLLMLLFGTIEFGRLLLTLDVLQESARRGARVAAVCEVGNAGVKQAALFHSLRDLGTDNVDVQYLDENGNPTGTYEAIRYVRVTVSDYPFRFHVPLIGPDVTLPAFSATLPRESLGVPKYGEPAACYEGQ